MRRAAYGLLLALTVSVMAPACSLPFTGGDDATPSPESAVVEATATVAGLPSGSRPTTTATGGTSGGDDAADTILIAPEIPERPPATGDQSLTFTGGRTGPSTLDPALVRDSQSAFLSRQIFRGLVRFDDNLDPVPDLADRIEISADGSEYIFVLRPDSTFHDGRPIRAADVKYSLERATDPALAGGDGSELPAVTFLADILGAEDRLAGRVDELSGVEVIDDLTVGITLSRPIASFLPKLAGPPGMIVDREDIASGDSWWRSPNGSGPFKLTEWLEGERIVLGAHDGYVAQPPTLERVTVLIGAAAIGPMALYERGEIDFTSVPTGAIERVQASNSPYRHELVIQPVLSTSAILINPNIPPFDDIDFRRALIRGFDRKKIASVALDGLVMPATGLLPPGMLDRELSATLPPYDLDAARAMLDDLPDDDRANTLTFYTAGSVSPVILKKVYERDLGLDVDVIQLEWNDYVGDMIEQRLPLFSLDWTADYLNPESFLRSLFHSGSPDNYAGYRNPEVDRFLDEAMLEQDADRRADLFEQAQQQILDDAVLIPLFYNVDYRLLKPYLRGVSVTPMGILGLESVWMAR